MISLNMKLQQMKDSTFFVTLPKQVLIALGWRKGDTISYRLDKANIVLSNK